MQSMGMFAPRLLELGLGERAVAVVVCLCEDLTASLELIFSPATIAQRLSSRFGKWPSLDVFVFSSILSSFFAGGGGVGTP